MRIADHFRDTLQPLGDHFGVLDEIGGGIDDTRHDDLVLADQILQVAVLVSVARVGEGQHEAADLRAFQERNDHLQLNVEIVRTLVVAPAQCSRTFSGGMSWIAALMASTT